MSVEENPDRKLGPHGSKRGPAPSPAAQPSHILLFSHKTVLGAGKISVMKNCVYEKEDRRNRPGSMMTRLQDKMRWRYHNSSRRNAKGNLLSLSIAVRQQIGTQKKLDGFQNTSNAQRLKHKNAESLSCAVKRSGYISTLKSTPPTDRDQEAELPNPSTASVQPFYTLKRQAFQPPPSPSVLP